MQTKKLITWVTIASFAVLTLIQAETAPLDYTTVQDQTEYSILTPSLQNRKTAKIQLKNGMQVYLISDPDIDQSAASMSVEAGSWQDPEEYPGMAHFLEHMLFMGNKAYPNESEYSQYIQDHGGSMNAFTAPDRTVYMFSINNNAFEGALDRFSHFFIDPLFNPSCINRELLAVDQENSKNIENDSWREYMVLKETGNPKHPNRKFSTGNAQTLSGIPQEALKTWYHTHYSADHMHLILLSSLPLETMIELASEDFSAVPTVEILPEPSLSNSLLSNEQRGHFIYIKPIKDLKTLSLVWELPKEFASIQEKWTVELVSYALEQSSENSLIQTLKKEGLAESLSASGDRFGKNTILFQINVKLTDKGLSQIDTVILRCYQALARLKQNGLPLALFQEMQTMAEIDYEYQSRQEPFSWITDIAYNIVDEDLSSFPEKTMIPSNFNAESLEQLLNTLTPQSCAYFVVADPEKLDIHTLSVEKWSKVEYAIKPITPSKLSSWQQASLNPSIQIPPPNPFVLSSLELLAKMETSQIETIVPSLLMQKDQIQVYFAQDFTYQVPESILLFHLKTPSLDGSAKAAALGDLFSKSVKEEFSSTLFFASKAGLSCLFTQKDMKFSIQIQGYSEKAPDLAKALFTKLSKIDVSLENFEIYKNSLLSSYANASCELPIKQALETVSDILLNDSPTFQAKLDALESLSFEDFKSFCKEWLSKTYLEALFYGNLLEVNAIALAKDIEKELAFSKPYLPKEQKKQELLLLPAHKGPFQVLKKTDMQGNGTVLVIQEGSFSFPKKASQQVLSKALHESFFKTLRTQQQIAYIADVRPSEVERQLMHTFLVQSSSHDPEDLLARFEIFLEDFVKRIQEIIPEERFNQLKIAQLTALEMPPENLMTMAQRLDTLAFDYHGDFKRIETRIEALKALSYKEFIKDSVDFLSKKNLRRLAVLVRGISPSENSFKYEEISQKKLEELSSYISAD